MIPSIPPPLGTLIAGKYRLEHELGRGGMGIVHQAMHEVTGHRVALKWLLPRHATDATAVARLLREARVAGHLDHPAIVRISDVEQHEGSVLLVMELLQGESLASRLARGAMSPVEALELLGPVMRALAFAHERGVVHRDVKPENVFLHRSPDGVVVPKILDFGIAKVLDPIVAVANVTETRSVLGSPLYMSPEQLRGAKNVDPRTDIYSMGVVLFQALTGRVPHKADTFGELVLMVSMQSPPPLRALRPDLSPALEWTVARALAKDPAQRFADMASFLRALEDAVHRPGAMMSATRVGDASASPAPLAATRASSSQVGPMHGGATYAGATLASAPSLASAPPLSQPSPSLAGRGNERRSTRETKTGGSALLITGCVVLAVLGLPCLLGGGAYYGCSWLTDGFARNAWQTPACLVDANGDGVLDAAGMVGSYDSRRLTVLDGATGDVLWQSTASYSNGDQTFCPHAPELGVSGWVGVARNSSFVLDVYGVRPPTTTLMARTPDRADRYSVGRGCINVRSIDHRVTGLALPSGQLVSCDVVPAIEILALGEAPGIGSGMGDDLTIRSRDTSYRLGARSPGTPFLTLTATRAETTLFHAELRVVGVGTAATRVMAVTPRTVVVVGDTPGQTQKLMLVGIDATTGLTRYEIPYPSHTFTITSFAFDGRYVIATAPWTGLAAIDPDSGTVAWTR